MINRENLNEDENRTRREKEQKKIMKIYSE